MSVTDTMRTHTPNTLWGSKICQACTTDQGRYVNWPCEPVLELRIGLVEHRSALAAVIRARASRYEDNDDYAGYSDYIDGMRHAANIIDPDVDETMDDQSDD